MELPSILIDPTKNNTVPIILNLTEPLIDRGHTLWMDSYLNSLDLAHFLKTKSTDYVCT